MFESRPSMWVAQILLIPALVIAETSALPRSSAVVGLGWYPWYEIQVDPESPKNLIVCGTEWDSEKNAPFGFVHISTDGGLSWRVALEDRSTEWVSEHSCAFGPNHRAYFISEASWVVDGKTNHRRGITRLYVSVDAGVHWTESLQTGWADHSTSAVDLKSGQLYTFYNSPTTIEDAKKWGSSIGVLVFSSDGTRVVGPFFNPAMQLAGYDGVYPSAALAMKNGGVVALYRGLLPLSKGADVGVIRVLAGTSPSVEFTLIAHTTLDAGCPYLDKGAVAYDPGRDRLFVLYGDGCKGRQLLLTTSDDEGRTWAKSSVISIGAASQSITNPSLVSGPLGRLWILWEDGQASGNWLVSSIKDGKLLEPATTVARDTNVNAVRSDTLYTRISQLDEFEPEDAIANEPSVRLNVLNMRNNLWRARGLVQSGENLLAVWPSSNGDGMELDSTTFNLFGPTQSGNSQRENSTFESADSEVLMLYGGSQHFDSVTSTLEICLKLANRGSSPVYVPIELQAIELRPESVSISNSVNRQKGVGAIWDISRSVTGDRIPPGATSNPFCLDFHLDPSARAVIEPGRLVLSLGFKVTSAASNCPTQRCQPERPARAGALVFSDHSSASYASAVMPGP